MIKWTSWTSQSLIKVAKFQHHYLKNSLISTYIYPLTLPTPLDYSQAGIVHSTLFQILTLCSDPNDQILRTKVFLKRLQARGYKSNQIKPLFLKAIAFAKSYSGPLNTTNNDLTAVIFHLPFHPNDPPSHKFNRHVATPSHLPNITCPYLTCATRNQKKNATSSV